MAMSKKAASTLFTLLSALPGITSACSCLPPKDNRSAFAESGVVVVAEAIELIRQEADESSPDHDGFGRQAVVWEIRESFKGPKSMNQRITTLAITDKGMCGRLFNEGDVAILYLPDREPYALSLCDSTKPLKHAISDIPLLYELKAAAAARP
jgi:hypothetical protein